MNYKYEKFSSNGMREAITSVVKRMKSKLLFYSSAWNDLARRFTSQLPSALLRKSRNGGQINCNI